MKRPASRGIGGGQFGWCGIGNNLAAIGTGTRPHLNHPVRTSDDKGGVLDDDDGLAGIGKLVQFRSQQLHVRRVQTRRRLIQQVDRMTPARVAGTLQLRGELNALGLATR